MKEKLFVFSRSFLGIAPSYAQFLVSATKKTAIRGVFCLETLDKRVIFVYDNQGCKANTLYREERADEKQHIPYVHAL
jgi:hypothetical protein